MKVGCCGFQRSRKVYYENFRIVELQETFYDLPKKERMISLRNEAPKDFEFSVKCFQGVTHPPNSPTWKRSKIKIDEKSKYGNLQPSEEVFSSWNSTLEICKILQAKICLIQLPASFKDSRGNIENSRNFFSSIKRNGIKIAIELRGWTVENIKKLCEEYDLIHCVDVFASRPVHLSSEKILYTRLHGSPPGNKMYSYKYSDEDLKKLKGIIEEIKAEEKYVLFNNVFMFEDALRFKRLLYGGS